jgi:uncharacterized protein
MNNDLPIRIDPVLFAKQGRTISGEIPVREMSRVASVASDDTLEVKMSFTTSSLQFPMVKGTIAGSIVQTCQRCLGETRHLLDHQFELVLIHPDSLTLASKEGHEIFEYEGQFIDTIVLVEDEVILTLPIVPKHEDINECDPAARKWLFDAEHVELEQERRNPFASLKDLKI